VRHTTFRDLLLSTRVPEATLMCGFPVIGFVLGLTGAHRVSLPRLVAFLLATFLLSLGVYVFNGWANSDHDITNPRFAANWITHGAIPLTGALVFSLTVTVLSITVFAVTEPVAAGLAFAIFSLFAAYSSPGLRLKEGHVAPTLIHLAGGFLMVWLGYVMVRPLDRQGIVLAGFFSLVFTGGHFNHEALDMEADLTASLRTRAVRWGVRATLTAGIVSFVLADLILLVAVSVCWPKLRYAVPFLAIAPLHGVAFARVIRTNPSQQAVTRYRRVYRQLYLSAGAISALLTWWL